MLVVLRINTLKIILNLLKLDRAYTIESIYLMQIKVILTAR
jgi:hypothetical protein